MKKPLTIAALALLAGPLSAMAGTVNWTQWSNPTTGSFTQNGNGITVTYSGATTAVDTWENMYDHPASFTNAVVTNTPTQANGTLKMTGGREPANVLRFSSTVLNPVIDVFSLGQGGLPVSFNFLLDPGQSFTIGASGTGHWGGGTLTQSGNSITGWEGNGLLQFSGSYNQLRFTTPNYEYYYGFTVGAMATANAVPEPASYALLLTALGALALATRRRAKAHNK